MKRSSKAEKYDLCAVDGSGRRFLLAALAIWKLSVPDRVGGMLTGLGSILLAMGFAKLEDAALDGKRPGTDAAG